MKNKKILPIIICVILVVVAVVCAIIFQSKASYGVPYSELKNAGYKGSAELMLAGLANDECSGKDKTAYELAVENGYEKSKRDFVLAFLNTQKYSFKADKKASYDIAIEFGITCTEEQWENTFDSINEFNSDNSYYRALENGFNGTAADWLDCLKGSIKGKTAYNIACKKGYKGNEAEWLADLTDAIGAYDKDGKTLYDLAAFLGFDGTAAEWFGSAYSAEDVNEENRATYNLAVKNGFDGSFDEWLIYLVTGGNGEMSPCEIIRNDGYGSSVSDLLATMVSTYDDSDSAYDEAVFGGYSKTEEVWLSVISGSYSSSAYDIARAQGYNGDEKKLVSDALAIYNGDADSIKTNAKEIIKEVSISKNNHLIAELSDGSRVDLGEVAKGEKKEKTVYSVTFLSYDDSVIDVRLVKKGGTVIPPQAPQREGYVFTGWDKPLENIKSDLTVKAKYKKSSKPVIFAESVTAEAGSGEVTVAVSVSNNTGILGGAITVNYDSNAMTLKSAKNGEAFSDILTMTKSKTLESGCRFMWDGVELSDEQIKDGEILLLTFEISDSAPEGEYEIGLECNDGDFIDKDLKPISPELSSGSVKIVK